MLRLLRRESCLFGTLAFVAVGDGFRKVMKQIGFGRNELPKFIQTIVDRSHGVRETPMLRSVSVGSVFLLRKLFGDRKQFGNGHCQQRPMLFGVRGNLTFSYPRKLRYLAFFNQKTLHGVGRCPWLC